MIDRSNDDPDVPRTWERRNGEIAHCDLKMQNVLIGEPGGPEKTYDMERGRHAPYKVCLSKL